MNEKEIKIEVRFIPVNTNMSIEVWERIRKALDEALSEGLVKEIGMTMG